MNVDAKLGLAGNAIPKGTAWERVYKAGCPALSRPTQKDAQKEEEARTLPWPGTGDCPTRRTKKQQRIQWSYPVMIAGDPPIETAASC
jgi:hypothetical protein